MESTAVDTNDQVGVGQAGRMLLENLDVFISTIILSVCFDYGYGGEGAP